MAEVFPLGMRAKGVSLGSSFNWLMNFSVAISTPKFVANAKYGAYIFLGLMCVIGLMYVYFMVPETKNKTLDELDEVFGDFTGTSKKESELREKILKQVGLVDLLVGSDKELDSFRSKPEVEYKEKEAHSE